MPIDWLGINWPQTWIAIYTLATVVMVVVLAYAARVGLTQLKLSRDDSVRRLLKNFMEQWVSEEMLKARDKLQAMLREINAQTNDDRVQRVKTLRDHLYRLEDEANEDFGLLLRVPHFFELVSVLLRPDEAERFMRVFHGVVIYYFEIYEPWITGKRKQIKSPSLYEEFERLYNAARSRQTREA